MHKLISLSQHSLTQGNCLHVYKSQIRQCKTHAGTHRLVCVSVWCLRPISIVDKHYTTWSAWWCHVTSTCWVTYVEQRQLSATPAEVGRTAEFSVCVTNNLATFITDGRHFWLGLVTSFTCLYIILIPPTSEGPCMVSQLCTLANCHNYYTMGVKTTGSHTLFAITLANVD